MRGGCAAGEVEFGCRWRSPTVGATVICLRLDSADLLLRGAFRGGDVEGDGSGEPGALTGAKHTEDTPQRLQLHQGTDSPKDPNEMWQVDFTQYRLPDPTAHPAPMRKSCASWTIIECLVRDRPSIG